ncbi:hypothetical protein ACLOJK_017567 [Asimina triloba]
MEMGIRSREGWTGEREGGRGRMVGRPDTGEGRGREEEEDGAGAVEGRWRSGDGESDAGESGDGEWKWGARLGRNGGTDEKETMNGMGGVGAAAARTKRRR